MTFTLFRFAGFTTRARQLLAALVCGALISAPISASAGSLTGTYILKPGKIDTDFSVRVLGRGPVTGKFTNVSGKMVLNQNNPAKSRVNVVVDLASVRTDSDRVTGFLKSSAMFHVEKYPSAVFQSTRVKITGKTTAIVEGVLTMRGQRKRTNFTVNILGNQSNGQVAFEVSGGFFRSLYGMDAGLPIYADRVDLKISGSGQRG
ncbi:polyisoprenoid-binding protein [Rhodobacterales bacterium]|nr:polyisoprenoid-binding protein [Rhodobacterales bacterium]